MVCRASDWDGDGILAGGSPLSTRGLAPSPSSLSLSNALLRYNFLRPPLSLALVLSVLATRLPRLRDLSPRGRPSMFTLQKAVEAYKRSPSLLEIRFSDTRTKKVFAEEYRRDQGEGRKKNGPCCQPSLCCLAADSLRHTRLRKQAHETRASVSTLVLERPHL